MNKISIVTVALLLLTNSITQTIPWNPGGNGGRSFIRPFLPNGQTGNPNAANQGNQGSQNNQGGQPNQNEQAFKMLIQQNLTQVLNGSMNLQGLTTYAQGLSSAIANLATSAQPQDLQKMKVMFATINLGFTKFAPKPTQSTKRSADQIKSDLLAAVGGTLSFASLATYASQFSTALATLTTSSTGDQVAPVVNMLINIGAGLKQLAPQTQVPATQSPPQGQTTVTPTAPDQTQTPVTVNQPTTDQTATNQPTVGQIATDQSAQTQPNQ